jgi:hypothetical protein
MSLIENLRTKLFATAPNNLAVATMATAQVSPLASLLYAESQDASGFRHFGYWRLAIAAVWFAGGACLVVLTQMVLGRLKP